VRPTSIGWRRIEVRPFFGDLDRIEGTDPTPLGPVAVTVTKDGSERRAEFPPGATGELFL